MTRLPVRKYAAALRSGYGAGKKGVKKRILDEFCQIAGMHRKAAIRLRFPFPSWPCTPTMAASSSTTCWSDGAGERESASPGAEATGGTTSSRPRGQLAPRFVADRRCRAVSRTLVRLGPANQKVGMRSGKSDDTMTRRWGAPHRSRARTFEDR